MACLRLPGALRPGATPIVQMMRLADGTALAMPTAAGEPVVASPPWMAIAEAQARKFNGAKEGVIQKTLNFQTEVHTGQSSMVGSAHAWCAAFVLRSCRQGGHRAVADQDGGAVERRFRDHRRQGRRPGVDTVTPRLRAGLCAAALLVLQGGPALAGSVEGPYIVWMNLGAAPPQQADEQITAFVNGKHRLCWNEGALLYMRERPPGVTPALVRRALLTRDAAAQRRLRALLRAPFGEVPGFDGVVAYSDHGEPQLIGMPMKGGVRAEAIRSASGEDAWGATFCHVLPPISRRP